MKKMIPYTGDSDAWFKQIIVGKDSEPLLTAIEHRVIRRFDTYRNNKRALERVRKARFSPTQKLALESCYDGATKRRDELVDEINMAQYRAGLSCCQYCGINAAFDSIDHYLPKNMYPEFSVFALNLLPACPTCNNKKRAYFLANGLRRVLNLYFDELLSKRYLFAKAAIVQGAQVARLEYELKRPAGVHYKRFNHIKEHYRLLELTERFRMASNRIVGPLSKRIVRENITSPARIRSICQSQADQQADSFGPNFWEAAGYLALGECDDFLRRRWTV